MRIARAVLLLGLLAASCQTQGLAFTQDQRVEIVSPEYRELVEQPVTIDWEVTDDELADQIGDGVTFGVYMDIDPQPPGESLDYFGRDDPFCQRQPTCPDEKYLRRIGVHTTTETEMTFTNLPIAPGVDLERGQADYHDINLVLLDESGRRIGESAWHIVFEIERAES